jgi:hypothetical protein
MIGILGRNNGLRRNPFWHGAVMLENMRLGRSCRDIG